MSKVNDQNTNPLYSVRCTECGEVLENKFFPLDDLLMQYHNGKEKNTDKRYLFNALGIGAEYGKTVLPNVPPLLRSVSDSEGEEKLCFVVPGSGEIQSSGLSCFEEKSGEASGEDMTLVSLNIAAIVAQFSLTTGFEDIYGMLKLQWESRQAAENGEWLSEEKVNTMARYRSSFEALPCVNLSTLTVSQTVQKAVERLLDLILDYAEVEAALGGDHFAVEKLYAGWQYKIVNNRKMPVGLAVYGSNNNRYNCVKCCCSSCRKPIPVELGAYRQKIVGILGTQQTGKSTYLAALTDAITLGEVTTAVKNNGEMQDSGIAINAVIRGNANWERADKKALDTKTENSDGSKEPAGGRGGILWLYQHGFPPEKTPEGETLALSFLVDPGQEKETVMYTLVDIAGEVFYNDALPPAERLPESFIKVQNTLLSACGALLFVVSSRQLKQESNGDNADQDVKINTLVKNPQQVLACCQSFLPKQALPMAVVLTSADEINGGNLRMPLMLPYDIKNCRPLVWSDRKQKLVYNAETMSNSICAVREFVNKGFGNFVENLQSCLEKRGTGRTAALAAFAVSNGTQHAPFFFSDNAEKPMDYHTAEQMTLRTEKMRKGRFGVTSPLLWLLVCDGILEQGGSDYTRYSDGMQKKIQSMREKDLYK